MKILIADDDVVSRQLLKVTLTNWGHEPVAFDNGKDAWLALEKDDTFALAILDWMMPGMDGTQICRAAGELKRKVPVYIILLTARVSRADIVEGLAMGANDYITKPFDHAELLARVNVGERMLTLQQELAVRVRELEGALAQVNRLRRMLPICSYCKKIRSDKDFWQEVESFIAEHAGTEFSHGICPQCFEQVMGRPWPPADMTMQ